MEGLKLMNLELVAGIRCGDIPEWLLVEVLIRLPVKLVFRLKLVSKQWLSIISHPSFIRAYVLRALSFPQLQRWTFISKDMHVNGSQISDKADETLVDMYSCKLKCPSLYALPFPCTQLPEKTSYMIFGVSNGLVLYGSVGLILKAGNCSTNYSICNPATGQRIALPPQSSHFEQLTGEITGFMTKVESNVLVSYRVVCLHVMRGGKVVSIDVFASETGEWKEFNIGIGHIIQIETDKIPVVLNGIMHWMTREHGLLAYDPYRTPESLHFIALPKDRNPRFDYGRSIPSICDVHQGRLRYFEVFHRKVPPLGFSGIRVWMLNDCKSAGDDWSLLYRVSLADISCGGILFGQDLGLTPLSFHPFDPDIVYLGYKDVIVSYNFEDRKMEAHGEPSHDAWGSVHCFWGTLLFVIPPWPISIIPPDSYHPEELSTQFSSPLAF